jgi:excisionase family DNA binding protein
MRRLRLYDVGHKAKHGIVRKLSRRFQMSQGRQNRNRSGANSPAADRLLTVDQVADNWQVSPRTVRRMIADGRLPVTRLGRAVRIPAKAVAR